MKLAIKQVAANVAAMFFPRNSKSTKCISVFTVSIFGSFAIGDAWRHPYFYTLENPNYPSMNVLARSLLFVFFSLCFCRTTSYSSCKLAASLSTLLEAVFPACMSGICGSGLIIVRGRMVQIPAVSVLPRQGGQTKE